MLVIPEGVYYEPKFTYIWTLGISRFPDALTKRVKRDAAVKEIARCFLSNAGLTIPGELARVTGLSRPEAGPRQPRARQGRLRDDARAGLVSIEVWYPRIVLTPPGRVLPCGVRFVLAAAFCAVANVAAAQSFDCAKAQTRVEKMVCADRALPISMNISAATMPRRERRCRARRPACSPIRRSG